MAATTAPTTGAAAPPGSTGAGLTGLARRHPALTKLLALAVLAAVLVPLAHARWASGSWPEALTVDVSGPLGSASDWIIDNRDSHPLFLYFFGHVSNAVVLSVRAVYLVLLAGGWAGVTVAAGLIAWRVAGVKLAVGTAVAFLLCGVLGVNKVREKIALYRRHFRQVGIACLYPSPFERDQ